MRDWVRNDLAGKGAVRRHMIRVAIPAILVLALFWFIPASFYVHAEMTLPIFIPFVLFSHALNKVWRRHRLRNTGSTPTLSTNSSASAMPTFTRRTSNATGPDQDRPAVTTSDRSGPAQVAELVEGLRPSDQAIGRVDQLVAVALLRHR